LEHVVNSLAGTQITTHSVKRNPGSGKERLATKCATPTLRLSRLTGGSPRTVVDALAKRLETQHMLQNQLVGSKITLPLAIRMLKVNPVAEDGEPELGQWHPPSHTCTESQQPLTARPQDFTPTVDLDTTARWPRVTPHIAAAVGAPRRTMPPPTAAASLSGPRRPPAVRTLTPQQHPHRLARPHLAFAAIVADTADRRWPRGSDDRGRHGGARRRGRTGCSTCPTSDEGPPCPGYRPFG
jgi:hypothetical protein